MIPPTALVRSVVLLFTDALSREFARRALAVGPKSYAEDSHIPMTVESSSVRAAPPARSVHVERARKLLLGGAVGGVAATMLCLLGFGLGYGSAGVVSAAVAAALVLLFYGLGQYVMVLFADAGARLLLSVALFSYTTRVMLLGLTLLVYQRNADALSFLEPIAIFLTTVGVVVGWLLAEVWVFTRLRVGAYDTEYVAPSETDGAQ